MTQEFSKRQFNCGGGLLWRHAKNIHKIKTFHMTKCKAYLHEKLNNLKGVIRSRELFLTKMEEITTAALGKQGVTNYKSDNEKGQRRNSD